MFAMFWASLTSRGVNSRTSESGLKRELLASSTGENLKQMWPCRARKPARLRPVLALDVVDHGRFRPGEQGRDDQADALTGASRRKRQDVFRTIVPEIVEAAASFLGPAAHVYALPGAQQSGLADIG